MADRINSWGDGSFFGIYWYKKALQHSVKVPLWTGESWQLTWDLLAWLSLRWVVGGPAVLGGVDFQVLGLQWLHVILVDLQGGAQLYWQPRQDIVTRHQQQGLAVDFLKTKKSNDLGFLFCQNFIFWWGGTKNRNITMNWFLFLQSNQIMSWSNHVDQSH